MASNPNIKEVYIPYEDPKTPDEYKRMDANLAKAIGFVFGGGKIYAHDVIPPEDSLEKFRFVGNQVYWRCAKTDEIRREPILGMQIIQDASVHRAQFELERRKS